VNTAQGAIAVSARWNVAHPFDPATALFHAVGTVGGDRNAKPEALAWTLPSSLLTLPATLNGAHPTRQDEFRAGRASAALALQQLGATELQVSRNSDRSPAWPPGFAGSLSHTAGFALAFVVRAERTLSVGVDVETVLSAQTAAEIGARVLTVPEAKRLAQVPRLSPEESLTLGFSVKEASYKALYPLQHEFREFFDLEILEANEQGAFRVLDRRSGVECVGHWRLESANILSFVELVHPG